MTPEQLDLKRATAETIKGVGGLEMAATFCRVGKSALSDNQSVNHPHSFIALDALADLEPLARERSGWPHVTRALCRRMGGVFVPQPEVQTTGADLLQLLAGHAQEGADVARVICEAMADGKVCAADARKIKVEVAQAMELLARIDAGLTVIEQEGK